MKPSKEDIEAHVNYAYDLVGINKENLQKNLASFDKLKLENF